MKVLFFVINFNKLSVCGQPISALSSETPVTSNLEHNGW